MQVQSPTGSTQEEAHAFLAKYPEVQGIDVIMTDCHGIGRGKIIRRHELEALFASGRPMPASLFGQDVAGDDVDGTGLVLHDGGGDKRCWPVPGTLGLQPHLNRGQVLVSMYEPDGQPFCADPRPVLERQIAAARQAGFQPMGAFELEFYLVDSQPDAQGRYLPARYPLTGRRSLNRNTMSVDELDEMSPFFDMIYTGAEQLGLANAGQALQLGHDVARRSALDDAHVAGRLGVDAAQRHGRDGLGREANVSRGER